MGGENKTYEIPTQNKQSIVNKLKSGLNFFHIKQSEDHKDGLPFIYSIIKMHKTPNKFSYIISSRLFTTKPLVKAAMPGLKECQKSNHADCQAIKNYTGICFLLLMIFKRSPVTFNI